MIQTYLEVDIHNPADFTDVLIAELDQLGYDSFEETDSGIKAFVVELDFDEEELKDLQQRYEDLFQFSYSVSELEKKNWNEEWEKNFEQTIVNDDCIIRASFHVPEKEYKYEIIITPRMSFGTGHHGTTTMMLLHEMDMDMEGKKVLDAGCGTAILAIMAKKRGASQIFAYDIDDWAYDNSADNLSLNDAEDIQLAQGDVSVASQNAPYDIILANINKNVLLKDIPAFANILSKNGYLVLSGFYENDIEDLLEVTSKHGLKVDDQKELRKWVSLRLIKEN